MTVKEQKPEFYNLGALAGAAHEQEKILKIIERIKMEAKPGMVGEFLYVEDLIDYIKNGVDPS